MTETGPYAAAAHDYLKAGWPAIPVPPRKKGPPPAGWTGYAGLVPSAADVQAWVEDRSGANIALRMPQTVLGIDVDAYEGKPGAATMDAAVARLGPLPNTVRSTSRTGNSGIRFYRVPGGRAWADVLGPGVEIIHHGHRYALAWPSVHPTGATYRWLDAAGQPQTQPPPVDQLPELPPAWVDELARGAAADRAAKAPVAAGEVPAFLGALPIGQPCRYLTRVLEEIQTTLADATSRHDTVRDQGVARIVRAGEQGHSGSVTALEQCRSIWLDALRRGASRQPDPGEWERMVEGAIGIVIVDPTPAGEKHCCGKDDYGPRLEAELLRQRAYRDAEAILEAETAAAIRWPGPVSLTDLLAEPDEPITYRVEQLWPTHGRLVIAAQRKAGKTTLRDNLLRSLADGTPFLGRYSAAPLDRMRTIVVFDTEMSRDQLRRWLRAQNIRDTGRILIIPLRGRAGALNLINPSIRNRWADILRKLAAQIVFLDCLRPVLDQIGLSEDHDAGRFLAAFDEFANAADIDETAVVHHMGHTSERSRGDSRLRDWPDAEWRLLYSKTETGDDPPHDSARYFSAAGRDVDQPEARLEYDADTRRLSFHGGNRRDGQIEDAARAVLGYLKLHPGISGNAVETALSGDKFGRNVLRAGRQQLLDQQLITTQDGPRQSKLYYPTFQATLDFASSPLDGRPSGEVGEGHASDTPVRQFATTSPLSGGEVTASASLTTSPPPLRGAEVVKSHADPARDRDDQLANSTGELTCTVCGYRLDSLLIAQGHSTHPTCNPPAETESSGEPPW